MPTAFVHPNGFFMADMDAVTPGLDVLYVADDSLYSGPTGNAILKYSKVGSNWVSNGLVYLKGAMGMAATQSGNTVTMYLTGDNKLWSFTDASGYNAALSGMPVLRATAPANTFFKGVAFAPEEFPLAVGEVRNTDALSIDRVYTQQQSVTINWQSRQAGNARISLTDMMGREIYRKQERVPAGQHQVRIQADRIPGGICLLQLRMGSGLVTRKVWME